MPIIPKDKLREYKVKDAKDIQEVLKKLFGDALQEILESELDHELGYSKYDYKNKTTENSRNGYSKKSLKSDYGELLEKCAQRQAVRVRDDNCKEKPERHIFHLGPGSFHVSKRYEPKGYGKTP